MTTKAAAEPQNLEAEESVLGALMLVGTGSSLHDAIAETGLVDGDFYRPSHGVIYRGLTELANAGEPTDAISLASHLEQAGRITLVEGGRDRIYELAGLVPPTANAPHWAKIVHGHATERRLIRATMEIGKRAREHSVEPDQLAVLAQEMIETAARNGSPAASAAVRLVSFDEFTAVTEDTAVPLIGTETDTLLPADGLLLMYGDGGAGKTTLSIDALAHAASGTDWLGLNVPEPVRIALIENEGPRGPFRRMLATKASRWQGDPFRPNVHVLEEPWTRFTLTDPAYRRGLARELTRTQTQLVIVGPLASLGAKGAGTPDDVNEFSAHIADLKARIEQPVALWIVHHENKAGDVSGAWERVPDTLVHVSAQGNGRTHVAWRKVRWSSALHNTNVVLRWHEGGFQLEEKVERDLHGEIAAFLTEHPGSTTSQIRTLIKANHQAVSKVLDTSSDFSFELGTKNAKHWSCSGDAQNSTEQLFSTESGAAVPEGALSRRESTVQEQNNSQPFPTPGTAHEPIGDRWFDE